MKKLLSLQNPSAAYYATIALLWTFIGLIALLMIVYFRNETDISSILRDMLLAWPYVSSIGITCGSVIGSIHYLVARACGRKDKQSLKPRETSAVILTSVLICAYPAYYVVDINRVIRMQQAYSQEQAYGEIASLVNKGDTQGAVRVMEDACEVYLQSDRTNVSNEYVWLIHHRYPSGFGYYYNTLGHGWLTLSMNLPRSVHDYLNAEIRLEKDGAPKEWQPLGISMAGSRMPIIRVLGYALLDDRMRFSDEVYRQYDSGDQTYRALKDVACFEYDPDLKRALRRILAFTPMPLTEHIDHGRYLFYDERDRDERAYELAIQILESGQTLDDLDAIRPMVERYLQKPESERRYDLGPGTKHAQAHGQLMGQLGLPTQ